MTVEERVHLFMESQYGTFVPPDSRDANDDPSMSAEDYARFMQEAAHRLDRAAAEYPGPFERAGD
jgi:hypothetical protein